MAGITRSSAAITLCKARVAARTRRRKWVAARLLARLSAPSPGAAKARQSARASAPEQEEQFKCSRAASRLRCRARRCWSSACSSRQPWRQRKGEGSFRSYTRKRGKNFGKGELRLAFFFLFILFDAGARFWRFPRPVSDWNHALEILSCHSYC